jgi:hypothetical protein
MKCWVNKKYRKVSNLKQLHQKILALFSSLKIRLDYNESQLFSCLILINIEIKLISYLW